MRTYRETSRGFAIEAMKFSAPAHPKVLSDSLNRPAPGITIIAATLYFLLLFALLGSLRRFVFWHN
jgi:hypothetical protein